MKNDQGRFWHQPLASTCMSTHPHENIHSYTHIHISTHINYIIWTLWICDIQMVLKYSLGISQVLPDETWLWCFLKSIFTTPFLSLATLAWTQEPAFALFRRIIVRVCVCVWRLRYQGCVGICAEVRGQARVSVLTFHLGSLCLLLCTPGSCVCKVLRVLLSPFHCRNTGITDMH